MKIREKSLGLQLVSLVFLVNITYLVLIWFSPHSLVFLKQSAIPYPAKIWLVYFLELTGSGISSPIALAVLFAWHVFTLFGFWHLQRWAHRSFVYILVTMIVWGAVFPYIARGAFNTMRPYFEDGMHSSAALQSSFAAVAWLGEVVFLLWGLLFVLWFVIVPACSLYYLTEPRTRVLFNIPIFQDREKYARISIVLYLALIILSALIVLPFIYGLLVRLGS